MRTRRRICLLPEPEPQGHGVERRRKIPPVWPLCLSVGAARRCQSRRSGPWSAVFSVASQNRRSPDPKRSATTPERPATTPERPATTPNQSCRGDQRDISAAAGRPCRNTRDYRAQLGKVRPARVDCRVPRARARISPHSTPRGRRTWTNPPCRPISPHWGREPRRVRSYWPWIPVYREPAVAMPPRSMVGRVQPSTMRRSSSVSRSEAR
jgi:hypothetical protein